MKKKNYQSHLPARFGMKRGAEEFPLMVLPSVANVCNSRCWHCWYTANPRLRKRDGVDFMPAALLKKIINEVAERRKPKPLVRITGTGEPFLMPGLTEILVDASQRGVRVAVITNGTLLTPERSTRLIDAGLEAIECSVDAADKQTYEKIRRGLKFQDLLSNIDHVLRYRAKVKARTKIVVSAVDTRMINAKEVEKFWRRRVDNVIIRKYLTYGQLSGKEYSKETYLPPDQRVPCPYPFERMVILASGAVTFCNFDVEDNFFMGNINRQTIAAVWRGKKFEAWRKLVLAGRFEEVPLCAKCSDWKYKSWTHNFFKVLKNAEKKKKEL